MGTLCLAGGITGFARTRSIPSLVAGVRSGQEHSSARKALAHTLCPSVGLLYLWSADSVRKGTANGLEGALGVSPMSNYL